MLQTDFAIEAASVTFEGVSDLKAAVSDSDIIITVTPSHTPLIQKEWVRPGTHFSCIGAVVKKDWFDAYKELMADAVVAAHIPLTIEDIGDFLIDRGYIGLRRTQTLEEILTLANSL